MWSDRLHEVTIHKEKMYEKKEAEKSKRRRRRMYADQWPHGER